MEIMKLSALKGGVCGAHADQLLRRTSMANQMVKWEVKDGIGTITLNRPEKRNAINGDVLEGIDKVFSELSLSLETKVILLQGAGPVFSAGIDFNYLAA